MQTIDFKGAAEMPPIANFDTETVRRIEDAVQRGHVITIRGVGVAAIAPHFRGARIQVTTEVHRGQSRYSATAVDETLFTALNRLTEVPEKSWSKI